VRTTEGRQLSAAPLIVGDMKNTTRKYALPVVAAVTAASLIFTAPATAFATANQVAGSHAVRGQLVRAEYLATIAAKDVSKTLTDAEFQDPGTLRYGVVTYRLTYRTVDPQGRSAIATGLLALPVNGPKQLKVVSYTHGTTSYWLNAPSTYLENEDLWGAAPSITYAASGFATVAPDYLGLGKGQPMVQPYLDIPSETTVSLDMLRAARTFATNRGLLLRKDVLVNGFSQGAMAAIGLGRALQHGDDSWFRLGALSAISGAYDFAGVELPALTGGKLDKKLSVIYSAYLTVTWNKLHHLYNSPKDVFQDKYADKVEKLFDGRTPGQEMFNALPGSIDELFTPAGLDMLGHPTGRFAAALVEADSICKDWAPKAPVRLLRATSGDNEAASANTDSCHASFLKNGVNAPITNLTVMPYGGSNHLGSNIAGVAETARWFAGRS
jgi:hypothetical protein